MDEVEELIKDPDGQGHLVRSEIFKPRGNNLFG